METEITNCAYCGEEICLSQKNLESGKTGEPYCEKCKHEEEVTYI